MNQHNIGNYKHTLKKQVLYLMGGAHQNVVGDFSKRYSQVDDVILCTAALRQVADVNNSACRGFSWWKGLEIENKQTQFKHLEKSDQHLKYCSCLAIQITYNKKGWSFLQSFVANVSFTSDFSKLLEAGLLLTRF